MTSCTIRVTGSGNDTLKPIIEVVAELSKIPDPVLLAFAVQSNQVVDFTQVVNDFNRSQNEIFVVINEIEATNPRFFNSIKLGNATAVGAFDIILADQAYIPALASQRFIANLNDFHSPIHDAHIYQHARNAAMYNGNIFAIPFSLDLNLVYFRRDAATHSPYTLTELLNQNLVFGDNVDDDFVLLVEQFSHGSDLRYTMSRLATMEFNSLTERTDRNEVYEMFVSDDSIEFMLNGPQFWAYALETNLRDNLVAAALPTNDGRQLMTGKSLAIGINCQYPELAYEFIKYLTSPSMMESLAVTYSMLPPSESVLRSPMLARRNELYSGETMINLLRNAVFTEQSLNIFDKDVLFYDTLNTFFEGRLSVSDFLEKVR
jgi:maltose-binding protein MalE